MKYAYQPSIDWEFRPESYWDAPEAILANVKGQWRRRYLSDPPDGQIEDIPEELLANELSAADRAMAGRLHPSMMGGEYLPAYRRQEIEIARVVLASVTQDVISIRARPRGQRIAYRVVDEYEDGEYVLAQRTSMRPLILRKLVSLIDDTRFPGTPSTALPGLVIPCWSHTLESSRSVEEATRFATVESSFYPQITDVYALAARELAAELGRGNASFETVMSYPF